jgi:hypothetical protein
VFLFVTPGSLEVDFFRKSCVFAGLSSFSILSTDFELRDDPNVAYFCRDYKSVNNFQKVDSELTSKLLSFYGMTAKQLLGVDRTLPESYRKLGAIESINCLNYFICQFERILINNNISAIYTGCGPEIVRLISYFWANEFNVPIYMHAYFGIKDKIVYFDNPIKYNLVKFNVTNEFQGFVKLDPEYINQGVVSELLKIYNKFSVKKFVDVNKVVGNLAVFTGNILRGYRHKSRLNMGSLASLEDLKEIKSKKILLPLHLYDDFVLTVLNRNHIKQFDTVREVLAALENKGWVLIVKEHPADICGKKLKQYRELESVGAIFCDPYLDSTEVLLECDVLLTICSTYAIESMMESKPVVLLGNSFYRQFDFCYTVENIATELFSQLDSIDEQSLFNKTKKFKLALDELQNNSFNAPLPYLGRGDGAINSYAKSIIEISKTLETTEFTK